MQANLSICLQCQYQVVLTVTLDDGETFSAQPCDICIHSHSDTKHMPTNADKLMTLKHQPIFREAMDLNEVLAEAKL